MGNFILDIVDHHWIDRDPGNETDECSHGRFLLTLGGVQILSGEDDINDWTTSTSVLRLLRTLEDDFIEDRGFGIILHCGMLPMISCPISIDWQLVHAGGKVLISEIKKYPSSEAGGGIRTPARKNMARISLFILIAKLTKAIFDK